MGSKAPFAAGHNQGGLDREKKVGFVSHESIHQMVVADKDFEAEARLSSRMS